MHTKDLYITGLSSVTIQPPLSPEGVFSPVDYASTQVRCMEPVFRDYFDPMTARRMSRIIKRAVVTAKTALKEAGLGNPDAIVTGTGLGCVEDTEKFLESMITNNEQFLQPTYFIQSTHNTISSQIALNLGCNGYNNTYIHRGVSFENALMDALLLFNKNEIGTALLTGNDEMTPAYFILLGRIGYWRPMVESTLAITRNKAKGSFAGEGSISLVLAGKPSENAYAKITGFDLCYKPGDLQSWIGHFLHENGLSANDIDLVLTGMNGDETNDAVYESLVGPVFRENQMGFYKNVCGEFFSASAYGMLTAATCLKEGRVPAHFTFDNQEVKLPANILVYNHFQNKDHSLTLLSRC